MTYSGDSLTFRQAAGFLLMRFTVYAYFALWVGGFVGCCHERRTNCASWANRFRSIETELTTASDERSATSAIG